MTDRDCLILVCCLAILALGLANYGPVGPQRRDD